MYFQGLFYEISGEGEPIIFLPGIGASSRMFKPQVNFLKAYFKTITVDLLGAGKSEPLKVYNPWKCIDIQVQKIVSLIEHLQLKKVYIVGVSYGGIVAQRLSIIRNDLIRKLVLVDTYGHVFPRNYQEFKVLLFGSFVTMSTWFPHQWTKGIFSGYQKWDYAYNEMMWVLENRNAFAVTVQMLGCFGLNYLPFLKECQVPVLGIVGDAVPAVMEKTKEIIETVPKGELVVVKNAFDPSNLCQPDEVNQAIYRFIEIEKDRAAQ